MGAAVLRVASVVSAATWGPAAADPSAAPRLLSCEHLEVWAPLAATVHATSKSRASSAVGPPDAVPPLGLPAACSQLDEDLFKWADHLTAASWPDGDNAWDVFRQVQYDCDPDAPEPERGTCVNAGGTPLCLHGFIAACACMATMFASNADAMQDYGPTAMVAVRALLFVLRSPEKMLEFLDSASWVYTLPDIAAILEVYGQALRELPLGFELDHTGHRGFTLLGSSRPWDRGGATWLRAERAARESLAMVSAWRWPPRGAAGGELCTATRAADAGPRVVRLWAFGTHCSVMAEPVASMALLLADDFEFRAVWRGGKDYCGYLASPGWPVVSSDPGSAVREVYDEFHQAEGTMADTGSTHRDTLRTPLMFEAAFREALRLEGGDFDGADIALCSEPAIVCAVLHEGGKPVIGYFGVHIGFMVRGAQEQLRLYRRFRDELASDARSTFATVAPYLSLQMFRHIPVEVPAVRPLSLYTMPATYTAASSTEVLLNKRPVAYWDLFLIFNGFTSLHGIELAFVDAGALFKEGRVKFSDWCDFRAAVYFPYDWLQTMAFYDWVNMALPTFVPDSPVYTINRGTNAPHEWEATLWHIPSAIYPHHYSDWDDIPGRTYWWLMTDFKALPGVVTFASVSDLLIELTSQDHLWRISGQLRSAQQRRVASGAAFWRGALLRALGR